MLPNSNLHIQYLNPCYLPSFGKDATLPMAWRWVRMQNSYFVFFVKKMKNYSCQKIISSSEYHIFIAVCAKMWWEGWEYFEKKKNNFSLKNSILSIVMAFSWIVPICYILRMWLSNWNTTLTSTQRGPCTCDLYWHHTDLPAEGWLRTRDLFMHNWKGWVLQHGQFLEPHVYAKRQCTSI